MDTESLHKLGSLGKPWGHLGELHVHLTDVDLDDIVHAGSLFVDIEGQKVPFFFTKLHEKGRDTLIKFDEIDDPQAASILVGREIFAPPGHFADASDESLDPEEFIGLLVKDAVHGDLGEVTGMEGSADNPVLVVTQGTQEVLIPLADEIIDRIDMDEGVLYVNTPPGLVDLYRSN